MSGPRAAPPNRDRTGSRLGPYEIGERIGAGAMGEVFRARDSRLDRDVALKLLPEAFGADPGRARRFEREARAASALNHPNIVTVYEVGAVGSSSYIAMELVEGRTLRDALGPGALPTKRLLDLACQIASGLARAHDAGIVHRDLKPENVMVTKDGFAKILDFGLAKRLPFEGGASGLAATVTVWTEAGTVLGTVGYMSPEQAGGAQVDFRSDQFSFGSILYEMATGARAFQKKTAVDTLSAILNEEPVSVAELNPAVPLPLRLVIERCLAKQPEHRYASTLDLSRELAVLRDHLTEVTGSMAAATAFRALRRIRVAGPGVAAAVLAAFAGIFLLGRSAGQRPFPDFQRLTFRRGAVWSARFVPDGHTIVYGAAWEGDPLRLFSMRTDGRDSSRIELPDADIASVSSRGEIAMLLGRPFRPQDRWAGTLARVPLAGGAPREMADGVVTADWTPDGAALAVVRKAGEKLRIEFPAGKVLFETPAWIESLRFSPAGDRLAFVLRGADVSIDVVDVGGAHTVLSRGWKRGGGLAWSPDGREVWFAAEKAGWNAPLFAVAPGGRPRPLLKLPSRIILQDVSRDGRTLVSLMEVRWSTRGLSAGETAERDLSWHEGSLVKRMTPDGKTLLFDEGAEGNFHAIYVRPMDGSPAKHLGEGRSLAISADGRMVLANSVGRGSPLVLLPTGAGEARPLDTEGHRIEEATFFRDGKRLLLLARDPGYPDRTWARNLESGGMVPIAPEGMTCLVISPDEEEVACAGPRGEGVLTPLGGGAPRPIPGFQAGDELVTWSADGRALYVRRLFAGKSSGSDVFRLDLATGRRELWHSFTPSDRAAVFDGGFQNFAMTPDGASYAYSFLNVPSDLYLVTGLK